MRIYPNHRTGAKINVNDVHRCEPSDGKVSAVLARHKIDRPIITGAIGLGWYRDVGLHIGDSHIHLRHDRALGIRQNALDDAPIQLGMESDRERHQERCQHGNQPYRSVRLHVKPPYLIKVDKVPLNPGFVFAVSTRSQKTLPRKGFFLSMDELSQA